MIASPEKAYAVFHKWLAYHWGGGGHPTMNADQVNDTARSMTKLFLELTGQQPTPHYSDRIAQETVTIPVTGNILAVMEHEIESWEAELAEAVSDNNFRNAADAQHALEVLNNIKDKLTLDD